MNKHVFVLCDEQSEVCFLICSFSNVDVSGRIDGGPKRWKLREVQPRTFGVTEGGKTVPVRSWARSGGRGAA